MIECQTIYHIVITGRGAELHASVYSKRRRCEAGGRVSPSESQSSSRGRTDELRLEEGPAWRAWEDSARATRRR